MLNKNNISTGVLIGLILPVLAGVVFELVLNNAWVISKRGIPYFVVVAANLIIIRVFAARHQEKTAQGIMLITFIFMVLVYFFRFR